MKIKIDGRFYDFMDELSINYKLDSVASVFSFKARFNPENAFHKAVFKPLAFQKVEVFSNDDKLLFTGTIINTNLGSQKDRSLQSVSGYSLGGVLEDCTIPYSLYPLEKLNVSLDNVVRDLLPYFGLNYIIDSSASNDMSLRYEKTVADASESVKSFISKLAAQRNIILSHNEKGDLVFFKPNTNKTPKFLLTKNNCTSMSLSINGQSLHSEISIIRQPSKDNTSLKPVDTIKNPMVANGRSVVKILSSGTETDTKKAADNALADELKGINISVELVRVLDLFVGDIVEVENDEIYLYNRARLVVSEIGISENQSGESMSLKLVLPETFTGNTPKNIFI